MIFVDTSFWVALLIQRDFHHREALSLLTRHQTRRLITSNHVRGETWTVLRRREGHRIASRFLDQVLRTPRLTVFRASSEMEDEALRWLRRRDEREYSFVDATSFQAMQHLGIKEAFAFDADFSAAGFTELRI